MRIGILGGGLVEAAARATAANRNSMLQDRGTPVPLTKAIVQLVHARERS